MAKAAEDRRAAREASPKAAVGRRAARGASPKAAVGRRAALPVRGVLVFFVFFFVFVVEVAVSVGEVGIRVIVHVLSDFADTQLGPQPVKVSAAAVVLELAGHLYLLGLGSAAPHWLDPLEHAGP